ncbi:Ser/Thr phosphatase family protein [Bifidobacterium callitrichos DSM 23973]|uniref:Ser/Thr phosphatase family protein n=2 Tax=Bifidobacterium callitrichos TaxID=762209 RepID=A0A087A6V6_9BIFI|nr:Ser/Thr phosphatase family protein [Bifidobacterium callitrichos DSM 23973]
MRRGKYTVSRIIATVGDMTETQRAPEGLSSKPRIRPAEAGETRPLSISARLGRLQFHTSGKFRVLQVADIQAGAKVAKDTIRLIGASLDAVRPDLVVFTGNQIAGYDPAFAPTFRKRRWSPANEFDDADAAAEAMSRTRDLVQSAIGQFLQPLIDRKVPFAVTYGNHDFQCGLDNAELDAIYRGFPGCVNPTPGVEADVLPVDSLLHDQVVYPHAVGTFALPVADPDNKRTVLGLVILDSGDYVHGGGFSGPSEDTLGFLREVPRLIGAKSGVFQHLPLPEYYGLLKPVSSTTAYAMQGYRGHASQYYVLDEEKVRPGGYLGEGISCPDESDEFAILSERDATDAPLYIGVATGHDHRNGFVGELDGVLMTATPTCGFDTYGPAPAKRATRLIEFDIRHPYEPRTQLLEFGELVGKPSSKKAYTYALNAKPPQEGEGDDLLRKPSLWAQIKGLFS